MNDLRGPLVPALERLAVDLATGRHGDPHVGFVVFVHPDREPEIVVVSERGTGCTPFKNLISGKEQCDDDEEPDREGLFFTGADLDDAHRALGDAVTALQTFGYTDRKMKLGKYLTGAIRDHWMSRRERAMQSAMDAEAEKARRPAKCPKCGQRYSERGLKQHIARSWYCGEPGRIRTAKAWGKAMALAGERGLDLVLAARGEFDDDREQRLAALRSARKARQAVRA